MRQLERIRVAAGQTNPPAVAQQLTGDRQTDIAACARHDGGLHALCAADVRSRLRRRNRRTIIPAISSASIAHRTLTTTDPKK